MSDLKVLGIYVDESDSIMGYLVQKADGGQVKCTREQMLEAETNGLSFENVTIFDRGGSQVIKVNGNVPRVKIYRQTLKGARATKSNKKYQPLNKATPPKYKYQEPPYEAKYTVDIPSTNITLYAVSNNKEGRLLIVMEEEYINMIKAGLVSRKSVATLDFNRCFLLYAPWRDVTVYVTSAVQSKLANFIPNFIAESKVGSPM